MEKTILQHVGEIGKECVNEKADVHNQLVLEVWSFLETLAKEERFQNIDFDIRIICERSKFSLSPTLRLKINTEEYNSFTDNGISTAHSSELEIVKKRKEDEDKLNNDEDKLNNSEQVFASSSY